MREQSQTGQVDMNSRSESSSDTHPTGGDMPAEMTAFDALAKELIETMRSKLKALLLLKHFEGDDGQYGATISPKWVTNVQSTLGSKVRAADQSLRAIDSIHSVLIPSIKNSQMRYNRVRGPHTSRRADTAPSSPRSPPSPCMTLSRT